MFFAAIIIDIIEMICYLLKQREGYTFGLGRAGVKKCQKNKIKEIIVQKCKEVLI